MNKLFITILTVFFVISCNSKPHNEKNHKNKSTPNTPKIVKIKEIIPGTVIKIKSFNSVLKPKKDIFLVSQSAGIITVLKFDIGTVVKKGDLLAVMDISLKKTELDLKRVMKEEAQHNLKYVKDLLEKDKILFKRNIINKETFDESKNRVILAGFAFKKASLAYKLAEITYEKSFIYAPFDGIITGRNKQKGDIAGIGTSLGRIIDNKNLQVTIGVTWEDLSKIMTYAKSRNAQIIAPDLKECSAKIIAISESTDAITGLYPVKLSLNDCNMINGTQVKVKIPLKEYKNAFELRRDILELDEENYYLFILKDKKAERVKVDVLSDNDNGKMIISLSGLSSESGKIKIITEGHIGLKNGRNVKLIKN